MTKLKIGIVGAGGRMGKMNVATVLASDKTELGAALEREGSEFIGKDAGFLVVGENAGVIITDKLDEFVSGCDAVIDFSTPASTIKISDEIAKQGKIHIIGTTGLSVEAEAQLRNNAKNSRIIYAPNMSLGVNLLFAITKKVAESLDEEYDIEILEMHHNKKVDSPSGTALGLGRAAAEGRKVKLDEVWCKARDGQVGARKQGEIGFATLRGGDIVGDHTAIFAADGERIELTHKASNRNIFSKGALRAAIWAKDQPNGLYNMQNVLGF